MSSSVMPAVLALAMALALAVAAPVEETAEAPLPAHYILSVTASGDFSKQNKMLQFSPENMNHVYTSIPYSHYEDTLAGAYDSKNGRYFLLTEEDQINIYDAKTLKQIGSVDTMPISIQYALGMHYDQPTDKLWVLYTSTENVPTQWCAINVSDSAFVCHQFGPGAAYQASDSAYDAQSYNLYVQLTALTKNDENVLFSFNTRTLQVTGPLPMGELCSSMEVAYVGNTTYLLCVRFFTNDVVKIDVKTGAATSMLILPPLHDPVGSAKAVRNSPDKSSASYFLQLQGPVDYHWVEIDVASHKVIANSSLLVLNNLPLAMTVYV